MSLQAATIADAYILDGVRTPFGKSKKALSGWRPDDLAAFAIDALLQKTGVPPAEIEDVVMGCVTQIGEQGVNIARVAALISGLPTEVPGVSLNRMCGSGQQATNFAAMAVRAREHALVLAGGVESMSRVEISSDVPAAFSERLHAKHAVVHQAISAEKIAAKWALGRAELDRFAYDSHMRAKDARDSGFFKKEIVPVAVTSAEGAPLNVEHDEGIRDGTTLDKLASLKPAFMEGGVITAGNSSQLTDGAAMLLVGSKEKARELQIAPRARIVATAVAGVDPADLMLTGPIPATRKVLDKAGLRLGQMDTFECNEAFASVPLAWMKELGVPAEKVNPNGGAIALGHPLGASGARLLFTTVNQLEKTGGRFGLVTMCIGFGQGIATVVERV